MTNETVTNETAEAATEAMGLEALVKVFGTKVAQNCVRKHILPQLIEAEQNGFWRA